MTADFVIEENVGRWASRSYSFSADHAQAHPHADCPPIAARNSRIPLTPRPRSRSSSRSDIGGGFLNGQLVSTDQINDTVKERHASAADSHQALLVRARAEAASSSCRNRCRRKNRICRVTESRTWSRTVIKLAAAKALTPACGFSELRRSEVASTPKGF